MVIFTHNLPVPIKKTGLISKKNIKNFLFKILLSAVFGLINSIAFCPRCFNNPEEPNLNVILYYALAFIISLEIVSFGVKLIAKKFDWLKESKKIGLANLLWLIFIYAPLNYIAVELNFGPHPERFSDNDLYFIKLNNIVCAIIIMLYLNTVLFFQSWKEAKEKEQKLKEHETKHELKALKNQINPHFLFNNLNTLSHLVKENKDLAEQYIYQLSTVYRYLLEQKNEDTVLISTELIALKALIYIFEVKHQKNLIFNINESGFDKNKVATFTLQMLVENAVKHNVIDSQNQLTIEIFIDENHLILRNNITKRPNIAFSSGIGLENIINRYELLSDKAVEVEDSEKYFAVKIPLL